VFIEFTTNPGQEIFLVTIDTINGNNKVTWEVVEDAYLEVRIYREASTDVYEQVGTTTYSSGSWTDEVSSVAHEWRYKIMILDTCNNLSALSGYHQTISSATVPIAGGGYRIEWTSYVIEGQKGVANYHILAVDGLGIFWDAEPIDTVSGSVNAYNLPIVDYSMFVVGAELGGGKAIEDLALSNLVNNPLLDVPQIVSEELSIYPNPAKESINIISGQSINSITVYSLTGQEMIKLNNTKTVDVSGLAAGSYTLRIVSESGVAVERVVVE
jgi:hypothetical protein